MLRTGENRIHTIAQENLHWTICKYYNIQIKDQYYEHAAINFTENAKATILCEMPIQTDKEIKVKKLT